MKEKQAKFKIAPMTNSTAAIIFTQFKNIINSIINIVVIMDREYAARRYLTLEEKLRPTAAEQECIDHRKHVFDCLSEKFGGPHKDPSYSSSDESINHLTATLTNQSTKSAAKLAIGSAVPTTKQAAISIDLTAESPDAKPAAITISEKRKSSKFKISKNNLKEL